MTPVQTIYTDLIPKGFTMELDGKIYIGTSEEKAKELAQKLNNKKEPV